VTVPSFVLVLKRLACTPAAVLNDSLAMTWTQTYLPTGSLLFSTLVAAIPVIVLLGLLASSRVPAHVAALAGLAASLLVAILVYKMPAKLAALAALDGAAYGLFPIGWIVLGAIFVYDITVHTGQFEIVKYSIAGIADDRRIQAILIAFSFGAFIEGAAGFGTPVAISAAMLIGLGFKPLSAATLALIGNTAPVAFGALGTPILALSKVTGIAPEILSAMVGRQLPFFSLIIPFWLICAMCGWRSMLEVWPACLVAGASFGAVQFAVSNFHGPWLVDVVASIASILAVLALLKVWKPRSTWRFDHDDQSAESASMASTRPTARQAARAWMPWVVVSILVFIWGIPKTKTVLNNLSSPAIPIPLLHNAVFRAPPVVAQTKAEEAIFTFNWLSATGTSLLIAAVISGLLLGLAPMQLAKLFAKTLHRVRWSLLTIAAMLAIGFTTRYAGLDATLGLAFAGTGRRLFPFFSPLLGWLGVALTGSDTSSNVLFGNLQQITAQQLGISPILAAASNSSGGVMGKMIDAQSIVVAGVATNQHGAEGQILRKVFFHSLALAALVGVLVLLQAFVLKGWVP
jgi:lactate permease